MKTVMVMGAGNMAHALVQGWSHASLPVSLLVLARSKSYQDKGWQTRWPVEVTHEPARISSVDTVILAVKPKDSAAALEQIRLYARPHTIVVSVMAGIPLAALEAALPDMRIVRAMPNIGSAVGSSTTAVSFGAEFPGDARDETVALISALGHTVVIDEAQMDSVTALSGSGPAYVFVLLTALIEAGTDLGLDPALSRELALHTLIGASKVALSSDHLSPEQLVGLVASPGGTTEAALESLERSHFKEALRQAIAQAGSKAKQLASSKKA